MSVKNGNVRGAIGRTLSLAAIAGLAGCAGLAITEVAPPITGMTEPGCDDAYLSRGRQTYLTRCTACHGAEPVRDYTREQWEKTLPTMCALAKLSASQSQELRAYVMAAIRIPAKTP